MILEGNAFVDVAGQRTAMKVYDSSHVPEGVPHRFVNASKTAELTILWVYVVPHVERLVTDYSECMGSAPPEPGEDGYVVIRPDHVEMARPGLVEEITARVVSELHAKRR